MGSLTSAAERRLHTSQPSLSRQIRELEDQVGVELLSRGARGVELTAAGRAFIDHARLALTQVDAAVEAARRAAQPAKRTIRRILPKDSNKVDWIWHSCVLIWISISPTKSWARNHSSS